MFNKIKETWNSLRGKEHNSSKLKMQAAMRSGRVRDSKDICYTDITDDKAVEDMRELCLTEHIEGVKGCPWPDICCHTGAINSFFDSVKLQAEELKQLRSRS